MKKVEKPKTNAIHNFNFTQIEIPHMVEINTNKNYYKTNENDDFFQEMEYMYQTANVHGSFIDNLRNRIVGSNFMGADDFSNEIIDYYDLKNLFLRTTYDFALYGGFCIEITWNALHTQINKLKYIPFDNVRIGQLNEEDDEITLFHYSTEWKKYGRKDIQIFPKFNPDPNSANKQFLYYNGIYDLYPRPTYQKGLRWVYTESELARFYSSLVKQNFVPTTLLTLTSFFDADKQQAFEKSLKSFTGGDAAGSIFVVYNEGGDDSTAPKIQKFNGEQEDLKYQWLSNHTIEQLIIAHNISNPLLAGVKTPGQLGGTAELQQSEKQFNIQNVYPKRGDILKEYNMLFRYISPSFKYDIQDQNIFNEEI